MVTSPKSRYCGNEPKGECCCVTVASDRITFCLFFCSHLFSKTHEVNTNTHTHTWYTNGTQLYNYSNRIVVALTSIAFYCFFCDWREQRERNTRNGTSTDSCVRLGYFSPAFGFTALYATTELS